VIGRHAEAAAKCDGERVAAYHHQGDQPPDGPLGIAVGADELGDVADWSGVRLDLAAPGGHLGAFSLEGGVPASCLRSSTRLLRALRCPSMMDMAPPVLPRLVASAIAPSIWAMRASMSATVWAATSIRSSTPFEATSSRQHSNPETTRRAPFVQQYR
jgi:hypothetical protein